MDKVHDTLGRRYLQAITTLNALKETRYAIGLVLALSQEEYYSYVEHLFELDYALDIFGTMYQQTQRNDALGNAICLTFLPRIVDIMDWVENLFREVDSRWEEGRDLNSEMGPLFIQVVDHLGLTDQELEIDFEKLLEISRSTARYVTAELVNRRIVINAYAEKKEALMAIMGSKTLNIGSLITRY
ncbi:MAG: hypothetical protein IJW36_00505 [Clostridia bacterium]|nr:hypothetical protein [Clostridia bacterium]